VLSNPPSATPASVTENQAEVNTSFLSVLALSGQKLFTQLNAKESGGDEAVETEPETPAGQGQGQGAGAPPWVRSVLGVDELFQQIRQENHDALFEDEEPADTGKPAGDDPGDPSSLTFPDVPAVRANEGAPGPCLTRRLPHVDRADTQVIDEAIASLWSVQPTNSPPTCPVAPAAAKPAPLPGMSALDEPDEPISVWVPLMLSTTLVIHASPLAETVRGGDTDDQPPAS